VLGPDWFADELKNFLHILHQEYLPTAMKLTEQFLADDVSAIQEQIASLEAEGEMFTRVAANHVRSSQLPVTGG
jgi:hypothetical protein